MIRINLLGSGTRGKTRIALIRGAPVTGIAANVLLLSTALFLGWWFWSLRQTSQRLDKALEGANEEQHRLQSVVAQVQDLENRNAQLRQRIEVVEQLRDRRMSPAHLLEAVAHARPRDLWLIELAQKGAELTIRGLAKSLADVSDLAANLEAGARFRPPVEIINTEKTVDPLAGELVKFSIKATANN